MTKTKKLSSEKEILRNTILNFKSPTIGPFVKVPGALLAPAFVPYGFVDQLRASHCAQIPATTLQFNELFLTACVQ
jgi:hypothetical protein